MLDDKRLAEIGSMSVDTTNPDYYKRGEVECIDAIKAATEGLTGYQGYLVGNAIKYLWRWKDKGGLGDVQKAAWYVGRLEGDVRKE